QVLGKSALSGLSEAYVLRNLNETRFRGLNPGNSPNFSGQFISPVCPGEINKRLGKENNYLI
ncbi:MAG TPA: hypothetical protein PLU24_02830, partial [Candidatus Omnitrophota bacterium]|nr:hypothetical protein [Candidatus Omnitrophota bacterium]